MATIQIPQLSKVEGIIQGVLERYARMIYAEAMSSLKSPQVRSSFRLEIGELRAEIWSDDVLAAYIEFGTGPFAAAYLGGKPTEMTEEAIKFYVNGQGNLPASPYLFPAFYKYRDEMVRQMDREVQKYFDSL